MAVSPGHCAAPYGQRVLGPDAHCNCVQLAGFCGTQRALGGRWQGARHSNTQTRCLWIFMQRYISPPTRFALAHLPSLFCLWVCALFFVPEKKQWAHSPPWAPSFCERNAWPVCLRHYKLVEGENKQIQLSTRTILTKIQKWYRLTAPICARCPRYRLKYTGAHTVDTKERHVTEWNCMWQEEEWSGTWQRKFTSRQRRVSTGGSTARALSGCGVPSFLIWMFIVAQFFQSVLGPSCMRICRRKLT